MIFYEKDIFINYSNSRPDVSSQHFLKHIFKLCLMKLCQAGSWKPEVRDKKKATNLHQSILNSEHDEIIVHVHVLSSSPQEDGIRWRRSYSEIKQIRVANQTGNENNFVIE